MKVPKVLQEARDKDGKKLGSTHRLALALCLLNLQPSNYSVVKGQALVPVSILQELKDLGTARIVLTSRKMYLNTHLPVELDARQEILSDLRVFVDQPKFQKIREDWAVRYAKDLSRQRWRYLNFSHLAD